MTTEDREKTKDQLLAELEALRAQLVARVQTTGADAGWSMPASVASGRSRGGDPPQRRARAASDGPVQSRPASADAFTRVLTDSLGEGVYALDEAGHVIFANPACERLLGYTEAELLGEDMHRLIHFQHADGTPFLSETCPLTNVMRSGIIVRNDADIFIRKGGSRLSVAYNSAPIIENGAVTGAVIVFHDITDRLRNERRLAVQYAVSRVLAESPDLAIGAPRLLANIGEAFAWEVGMLWLADGTTLSCAATWRAPGKAPAAFVAASLERRFASGEGLPGRVWQTNAPLAIMDVLTDDNFPRVRAAAAEGLHGAFAFPILGIHGPIGVIEFFSRVPYTPDSDMLQAIASLGNQVGQFVEHKRAEAAMRDSEVRQSAILEAALDAVISMDSDGHIVDFNPAAEEMFGYSRAAVVGESLAETIIPPSLRSRHREGLARYLATRTSTIIGRRVELVGLRADGTEFPLELAITRVEVSGAPLFTAYLRDITERKRADALQRALLAREKAARTETEAIAVERRRQADELNTLIEAMPDGVFVCDASGNLVRVSTHGAAMLGVSVSEALATIQHLGQLGNFRYPDGSPMRPEDYPLAQALRGVTRTDFRVLMRQNDSGRDLHMLTSFAPIRDGNGIITGAIAVGGDVSELYRLERQKDEFLSIASHELKTPLTTLKILNQLIHRRLSRVGLAKAEEATRMERAINRMERLVNDLLDASRIESGKLALERERMDLGALCLQAADEQHAATGRTIALQLPGEQIEVVADAERIGQVLTNLLSNALKYSPASTQVYLELTAGEGEARVCVRNTGPGIPTVALPHLFERFYRVPGIQVQSGSGVGLGLGLFITRDIILRHGGRIWAESDSEGGAGTTFCFTLLLAD